MKYQQIIEQLRQCEIRGGVWIDAGCGNGIYTIPLATLVSEVIVFPQLTYENSPEI